MMGQAMHVWGEEYILEISVASSQNVTVNINHSKKIKSIKKKSQRKLMKLKTKEAFFQVWTKLRLRFCRGNAGLCSL